MSARILIACALLVGACALRASLRIEPDRGGVGGGTRVRIEGDDFLGHGPVTVHFGDKSAKAVVIESPWLITITTPEVEEAGVVPLRIEFADGTAWKLPDAYTYEQEGTAELLVPSRPSN
jgi:hypothetical protein